MLAIERDPMYKNKFFLSGLAVLAGFLVTVGIIRAVYPADTSTTQSAQTNSERRATSIIPIKSSESESSSESDKKFQESNPQQSSGEGSGNTATTSNSQPTSTSQPAASTPATSSGSATPAPAQDCANLPLPIPCLAQ